MKIMYTRPEDNGVSIVVAAPKEAIERVLGPLTQEQYEAHVMERSIPSNAINVKFITDENIPANREFRNAWVDITDDNNVNICCNKAKELKLEELRRVRNAKLAETDMEFTRAIESDDADLISAVKAKRTALRNATEALKAIEADGIIDDLELLELIRQKSILEDM
jgi:biotin carboxylase